MRPQGLSAGQGHSSSALARYTRLWGVAQRCWPSLACLFITYTATLSVFPGVLAEVRVIACSCRV